MRVRWRVAESDTEALTEGQILVPLRTAVKPQTERKNLPGRPGRLQALLPLGMVRRHRFSVG